MKMSVVGCEASGKTVFLSALADYYNGDGRPCLVPENESANSFQRFQLRQMRSLRQWPPATDPGKTIELKWTLRQNGATISEVDLLEFGGETFREAFRGENGSAPHQEAVDTLKSHLGASEFVVVLVSLRDLLRDPGEMSQEEFDRDTEAVWVTRGLLEFLRNHAPTAKVVIGLTQADLHRGDIAAAGSAEALLRQRWPAIAALAGDDPIVPVASVSAVDENGNPAPGYTTDGILPVMNEFVTSTKCKGPKKTTAAGPRRTILLLLILAVPVALLIDSFFPLLALFEPPKPVEQTVVRTNVVESVVEKTNVVENVIETTNVVEDVVKTTNVVESLVVLTNVVENTVTRTNFVTQVLAAVPAFRTWHDHRGTAFEAKWIATESDRKRIVLEISSGRQVRASIRKLSEADQQYVQEQLNAATNSVDASAKPAL